MFFFSDFAVIWFASYGIYCSIVSERQYYSRSYIRDTRSDSEQILQVTLRFSKQESSTERRGIGGKVRGEGH